MGKRKSITDKNKRIQVTISNFKYITKNKHAGKCFKVSVPKRSAVGFNVIYCSSIRKAISTRNKIGRRIWGDYWEAVISGYVDTLKSETASVSTSRSVDKKRGDVAWVVRFRSLEGHKPTVRSFSCAKYGEFKAKELAHEYARLETENRLKRLANWNPRLIRPSRYSGDANKANRGSGARK